MREGAGVDMKYLGHQLCALKIVNEREKLSIYSDFLMYTLSHIRLFDMTNFFFTEER